MASKFDRACSGGRLLMPLSRTPILTALAAAPISLVLMCALAFGYGFMFTYQIGMLP